MSRREGKAIRLALLTAVAVLLLPAVANAATTRYAAPGGTATAAQCITPATPCSINEAAAGAGVMSTDEVVIAPGDYSDTAGDLGPNNYVDTVANTVHGAAGPRPVITLDADGAGFGAFKVEAGNTISHLEIDTAASQTNIGLVGGIVEDLIARSTNGSGPIVCRFTGTATLRDSACISSGDQGRSVGSFFGAAGTQTVTLRNVTAVASGTNSSALNFAATMNGQTLNVDAKSVIAYDTAMFGFDVYGQEFNGAETTITLDHSNFSGSGGQGTPTISSPFDNNNQIAEPSLAADSVHEVSGSPTINTGAALDGSSGATDIDAQPRTIGGTPDIGADEFNPTTTTVLCAPNPVLLNSLATCSATVTATAGPFTGTVSFASDLAGTFSNGGTCTVQPINATTRQCSLNFTPSALGTHLITASYSGDAASSQGTTNLVVTKRPTATSISCAPPSVIVGSPSSCTATVADTGAAASAPMGDVGFQTDSAGALGSGGTCALVPVSASASNCSLAYTPSALGTHQIIASFPGDASHDPSQGATALTVTAPPAGTAPGTAPGTTSVAGRCAGLRKKLKRAKKAGNTAKVQKLKRKLRRLGC